MSNRLPRFQMLFTDQDIVTQADLMGLDSEIETVAKAEKLLISGQQSIIRAATDEIAHWLTAEMQTFSGNITGLGISSAHAAAVLNIGSTMTSRPYARLSNVVASPTYDNSTSVFTRYAQYRALYLFWRAAHNRKLNDRYEFKMLQADQDAQHTKGVLRSCGLPLVIAPLPAPGALREPQSGSWAPANVGVAGTSGTVSGNYLVAITYVDEPSYVSQATKGNAESGPSAIIHRAIAVGDLFTVDINSLNPPTGALPARGVSEGLVSYRKATGWNLWIGADDGTGILYLQNASPIPIATKTYALSADPLATGYQVGQGQFADANYNFQGGRIGRA